MLIVRLREGLKEKNGITWIVGLATKFVLRVLVCGVGRIYISIKYLALLSWTSSSSLWSFA